MENAWVAVKGGLHMVRGGDSLTLSKSSSFALTDEERYTHGFLDKSLPCLCQGLEAQWIVQPGQVVRAGANQLCQ
jgi:hypothetical protein